MRSAFFVLLLSVVSASASVPTNTTVFPGTTAVGQASAPISVSVTLPAGGAASTAITVTQSEATSEFTVVSSGTCAGQSFNANQQCTVSVKFQPSHPGVRMGAVVVEDASSNVLGVAPLAAISTGSLAVIVPGVINTIAGDGDWIYRADGVAATAAPIFLPMGIVEDAAGNIFLSDSNNNRVRRVDAQTGLISTIAGTGTPGYTGDGGLAVNAEVNLPSGLLLDGAGDVYFVDNGNQCVRRIDAFSGVITTVAGMGGVQGYSGDGGPATQAKLSLPEGLAMDAQGDLYIADSGNNAIREVNAATGVITTIAGTGVSGYNGDGILATKATLASPWGVTVDLAGNVYIADLTNNRIRKVSTSGTITTVAGDGTHAFGGDGGSATSAQLSAPAAVVLDPAGDLYIADSGNNRIREVTAGVISTIAGTGSEEFSGDGGPANQATFYGPYALFFDQYGNLLIADMFHNRVRSISGTTIPLQYATMRVGKVSAPQIEAVTDDGNATLNLTGMPLVNAALDPATTTCVLSTPVSSGASCNLGVEFAPQTVGTSILGTVTVNSDASNSPDIINLSGEVLSVNPTSVALTSSENPSMLGDSVTFVATISSSDTTLGGTVTFLDGTNVICPTVAVTAALNATCIASTLTLGQHSITASYTGDTDNAAAVSPVLTQTVRQPSQLVLTATPNPTVVTSTVTMTATASAATGTPTGTIAFLDGSTTLGSVALINGVATFSTSQLSPGAHSLTASYAGDTTDAPSQSNAVAESISQATTVTTISSSAASVSVGTAVTFTANVSGTNGTTLTGTVQFMDGGIALGSAALANGTASLMLSTLAPGQHLISASYSGDTNDAASTSTTLLESVQQIGTVTAISSSALTAGAGATVQFTATVTMASGSAGDGAISGQVTFTDGGKTIGTGTIGSSGTATFSTNSLSVGAHAISASYNGNTNYAASASTALSESISVTTSATTLATSGNTLAGKSVSLTATVTSTTGVPTGTVTFEDNGSSIGQGTLNAQGIATFSTTSLSVGNHSLTAVYGGDTNYTGSTSSPQAVGITQGTSTLTLSGPASPFTAGLTATFTATLATNGVAPTGLLTLRDGSTVIGTQTVTATGAFNFTSSTLAVGSHNLTATYSGDTNNATSTSNTVVLTIQQGSTTTTLVSSQNPQLAGQSLTFTATVTSAGPNLTGTVNFLDGSTTIGSSPLGANGTATLSTSALTFGAHTITAVYAGDTNHTGSTSLALTQHIVDPVQIGLTSSANPAVSGTSVTFTVKVAGNGTQIPTGTVTFSDGSAPLSTATLDGTGAATYTTTSLAVGTHPITVAYAGDTNYESATSSVLTQTITNANTQITLTSSANPATYGSPLTLTAVITTNGGVATGTVTFTDGGTTIGSGVLNSTGTATLTLSTLAPGSHSIVANYAGDGKASGSVSSPLAVVVRQTTTVALSSNANPAQTLTAVTLTAVVTNAGQNVATGTITFTDGSSQLGVATLDATGTATLTLPSLSAGSHSIVASYSGDSTNFTAASGALAEVVQLRPTSTTLTATTDPTNNQQVTLIGVVRWTGTTTPTGTITFATSSSTVGSATIDATGVATLVIMVGSTSETITATYSGDTAYGTSVSPATTIAAQPSTEISFNVSPSSVSVQKLQHTTVTLSLASLTNFADTMQFGCLGLPYAATCTFSNSQVDLKAGGTATVQLTIDTGNPLGAGAEAKNTSAGASRVMLCFIPGALLLCFRLRRSRRKTMLGALSLLLMLGAALSATTGCSSGLQVNGTPAGTYKFQVTTSGLNTGISQSQTMTLTVTE